MCGGVEAADKARAYERVKVYFPPPKTAFPVVLEDETDLGWERWGRGREERGKGPSDGWAKLETVERGGWEKCHLRNRRLSDGQRKAQHWLGFSA